MAGSFHERSYWIDTIHTAPAVLADVPASADVAILGAGFTGLSAALALAKRGASVVVLERYGSGWGASSRNGGMVLSGLKVPVQDLTARFGLERARRMYRSSLAAIDCVERTIVDEAIDCDFARCGHLEVACKPSHFEALKRGAALLERDFDSRVRVIAPSDLAQELTSHSFSGGTLDERSARVNPASYVLGLASAARRAGAVICEQAPVQSISRGSGAEAAGFLVRSARGVTKAADVVVATGAYSGASVTDIRSRIIPLGSYVIATEPIAPEIAARLIPRGRMIFDSNHYLHYFRLTPDGRMLFGGRAAFFPETDRTIRESAEILRRGMVAVFPQLTSTAVEYAWGGTLDFTYDMLPHAGTIDRLHYAVGYCGHGVAMATYLGAQIARSIAGEAVDDPLFALPLPRAPLRAHFATPWLLPLAGAWFKILDWAS